MTEKQFAIIKDFELYFESEIEAQCEGHAYRKALDELPDDNERLNELYSLYEKIEIAKSKSDYLIALFTFSDLDEESAQVFGDMSSALFDYRNTILSHIFIIEEKLGISYWKEKLSSQRAKKNIHPSIKHSNEEIEKKHILQLVLKTGETHLFDRNDTAISHAVFYLTGQKFSPEQIRKDFSERGNEFSPHIYDVAIEKVEMILKELKHRKISLSPDKD